MMTQDRFNAELNVLRRKLGENIFHFDGMRSVKMAARTNKGNVYTLHMDLCGFPNAIPKVFVTKMLYSKSGTPLNSVSGPMHTLSSENNWTRICHYGSNAWTPMVSIYKIYIKCRLWLEMYEAHLETGNNIDYYLKHQS